MKEPDVLDRIAKLEAMIAKSPGDVFLHYSLAMECVSAGRFDQAAAQFSECIRLDASYLPAYAEAGKTLRSAGRIAEAREMFTRGLKLATAKGESHTADYIRQQLEGLGNA